jgi:hypothetical protein
MEDVKEGEAEVEQRVIGRTFKLAKRLLEEEVEAEQKHEELEACLDIIVVR